MRVALVGCSSDEVEALAAHLLEELVPLPARSAVGPEYDFAFIGFTCRRSIPDMLRDRVRVPAIQLVPSRDHYDQVTTELAALALDDLQRVRFTMRRERTMHDALAEREERYRALVTQVPGSAWSMSLPDGRLFAGPRITDLTGFTPEEFMKGGGIGFWESRIHDDDREGVRRVLSDLIRAKTSAESVEYRFRHKEERWVWLKDWLTCVGNAHGRRLVGISIDTSLQRAAEDALRTSEARYRSLVEQAQDIIFSIDGSGRILSLNRAFETVTGWTREEWIGKPFLDILDPALSERAAERFAAIMTGSEATYSEYRIRTARGELLTVEASAQAIVSDGHRSGIVGIARDVTRRKEAEALAEKEKRLASLGQLATSVAHDFNNVLMGIMPFAEVLQRRFADNESARSATAHIIGAVRRGREISQEILRFARPVAPVLAAVRVSEWLAAIRATALAMLGPQFEVSTQTEGLDPDAAVLADRALLDQVARNLIVNAREAMPDGGTIAIIARDHGAQVEIEIEDNGCGMPEALLDRIFEPLFTTKRAGNGLGLSIANQAMQQQGGAIRVRSRAGQGSTFTLTLPAAAAVEKPQTVPSNSVRRLVLVEDDVSVGEGLRMLLADEGFDVRLIERGADAITAIEDTRPELVLLDVNLPDVNGIDVYEQIHARWPELPVIFSTGHADARALENVRDRRVPSIMKPYDVSELLAVMATLA